MHTESAGILLLLLEACMGDVGVMTVMSVGRPLQGAVHMEDGPTTAVDLIEKTAIEVPFGPGTMKKVADDLHISMPDPS